VTAFQALEASAEERRKQREAGGGEAKPSANKAKGAKAPAAPPKSEPTLLKRLLGKEAEKEARVLLECIRFLVGGLVVE
jgi:hypothetical protein